MKRTCVHQMDVRKSSPMQDRSHLLSEQRLPESVELDAMSTDDAVKLMNAQDALAVDAVGRETPNIANAGAMGAEALRRGGRLI